MEKANLGTAPRTSPFVLEELLEKVTDENRHPEIDWGVDVGREVLESPEPNDTSDASPTAIHP
jgi:hypothetical protein